MNWEQLNAITGLVSAVCAVLSLAYFNKTKSSDESLQDTSILSARKLIAFLLGWSGWCLACLCILWLFQPFGRLPTSYEYKQFYAVIIAFPAFVFLRIGTSLMEGKSPNDTRNS